MRVVHLQYAGDYREVYRDLAERDVETYHSQRYAMATMERIAAQAEDAALVCCRTSQRYDEVLPNGVRVVAIGADPYSDFPTVTASLARMQPSHLVLSTPVPRLLRWALDNDVATLPLFADSFNRRGAFARLRSRPFVRMLNDERVPWVANHNVGACLSLRRIGVHADKLVPWDWPHLDSPRDRSPKDRPGPGEKRLLYVGRLVEDKGIGDVLQAFARMRGRGHDIVLSLAGSGDHAKYSAMAVDLGVADRVEFLGQVPRKDVATLMRAADVIVVPSHHEFPEGLPLTLYEAFVARTPVVASDHPMFSDVLVDRANAVVFRAKRPDELAAAVELVLTDESLYSRLSAASADAWERMQIPVKWGELIERWLRGSREDQDWLRAHRLDSGQYGGRVPAA